MVAWFDHGSYFELDGARVSPQGVVLDPGEVPLHQPGFPDAPFDARLAFAGNEYLLVWQEMAPEDYRNVGADGVLR